MGQITAVNHRDPDNDSIATTFELLLALSMKIEQCQHEFVPQGKRLRRPAKPGETPYHLDTGKLFDEFNIDHHQDRLRWPSAASAMLDRFPELRNDPIACDIAFRADYVDSAGKVNAAPEAVWEKKQSINTEGLPINVIIAKRGPWQVAEFIYNIGVENDEVDDLTKMTAGLYAMQHWYEQEKRRRAGQPTVKVDRVFFDKLCALYLQLTVERLWVFQTDMSEIMTRFTALEEKPGLNFCQTIMTKYAEELTHPLLGEIEKLATLYRNEGVVYSDTPETIFVKERLRSDLRVFNLQYPDHQLVPVTMSRGPWEIVEMLPGEEYSKAGRILFGLLMIRAWWHKKTSANRLRKMLEEAKWVNVNGTNFVLAQPTTFTRKGIRTFLRDKRNATYKVGAFVTKYVYPITHRDCIGVTKIDGSLNGMDKLKDALLAEDPGADVFLFPGTNFVIYVNETPGRQSPLTLEKVFQLVAQIIYPAGVPDYDDEESEPSIEADP
ncbi:hypothetical protein A2482_01925 [Candidatus Falkowbacteria bacterium RIFOXYC2_FULL_48_21]|uniref:Uncharacterized protein n=1 Tax=Candidatus Falkowbacteria bacterium RIFOXYC2_FULL_48_21 TaxID=1798005 RepID=A0A1F5T8N4_9BACT|nr:MAG: hypothetical protein A2482_01925 [Candidatus Falkowbacteria bacterium RIFOXYC2_FULL_48_21]